MENQHREIKGYRELTREEIDLMNEIKQKGEELEALCDKVKAHIAAQATLAPTIVETERLMRANPEHWEAWARGSMQSGLMYLTRAVAQPTTF